jgi:pimeloyl-ACP methyl ester carboxylesterase
VFYAKFYKTQSPGDNIGGLGKIPSMNMHIPLRALSFALILIALPSLGGERVTLDYRQLRLNALLEKNTEWPGGPTVLITHGTLSHNRSEIIETLQLLFLEYGISSLAINLSLGIDDRQGPYDCSGPHRHRHEDAVSEMAAWLGWLEDQGVSQVFPLGHSRGGNQTAWLATHSSSELIRGLILVAPQLWSQSASAAAYQRNYDRPLQPLITTAASHVDDGTGGDLLRNIDFLYCPDADVTAESFLSYYGADQRKNTPNLLKGYAIPVLVFIGSDDTTVPELVAAFEPLTSNSALTVSVIDGADHFFRDLYAEEVVEQAAEFIEASNTASAH